ncbi:MAG: macrocin O-methyltransferase [Desulfobulbaceae bacterium]|nr:macrocin O-methyltransferase [Desulfobulbaceae bacterium]
MLGKIKAAIVRKLVRLFRTALHDGEVRDDVRAIATELLGDPTVRLHVNGLLRQAMADGAVRAGVGEMTAAVLSDERVGGEVWKKCNIRPSAEEFSYAFIPNSVKDEIYRAAVRESARFAMEHMGDVRGLDTPFDVLSHCLGQVGTEGLYMEFGVYSGTTINHIAARAGRTVHGFDSFEGLPEQWGSVPAGKFARHGDLPEVRDNVELHVGWFEDTLPKFLEAHDEPAAFLHVDSDLYSSARTILTALQPRIVSGTVIVFDEFFNYPGWQEHEYRAFSEFIAASGCSFRYIGYSNRGFSVGVQITGGD